MHIPLPKRRNDSGDDHVLPLINIVFLMLVFFMVAGTFRLGAPFEVTPPATRHADDANPEFGMLAIDADGRLALGGRPVSRAELAGRLRQREGNAPLLVKADTGLPAAKLSGLLATLRAAGVARIRLLTIHRPGP